MDNMLKTTWVALVLGFWSSLYLIDVFLKTKAPFRQQYVQQQERWGFQIMIGHFRWYTTRFNRFFIRLGQFFPRFTSYWFELGALFGVVCLVVSTGLLVTTLMKAFTQEKPEQVLTPVMPGVNLPVSHITYFFAVLLVSGVVHEVGHAVAAVREQVSIHGFGLFLMVVYPGAYVDMHTQQLQSLPAKRQLKIYCAGIWHNFILVLFGIAMLLAQPYMLSLLYHTGSGLVVTELAKNSPVAGPKGLSPGNVITSLNGCHLNFVDDWTKCLSAVVFYPQNGYCMPIGKVQELNKAEQLYKGPGGEVECCKNDSVSDLCFYYVMGTENEKPQKTYVCLSARTTSANQRCHKSSDCLQVRKTACLYPSLDNSSRLIRVLHDKGSPVLYVGDPYLFGMTVSVSGYVPKYQFLPYSLPHYLETFWKYLISLSGALAILNAVPCYALDGQWIFHAMIETYLPSVMTDSASRQLVYNLGVLFGSLILIANVILALFALIFR